jgi:hypothetical protein
MTKILYFAFKYKNFLFKQVPITYLYVSYKKNTQQFEICKKSLILSTKRYQCVTWFKSLDIYIILKLFFF